jgi:hypothetical protein
MCNSYTEDGQLICELSGYQSGGDRNECRLTGLRLDAGVTKLLLRKRKARAVLSHLGRLQVTWQGSKLLRSSTSASRGAFSSLLNSINMFRNKSRLFKRGMNDEVHLFTRWGDDSGSDNERNLSIGPHRIMQGFARFRTKEPGQRVLDLSTSRLWQSKIFILFNVMLCSLVEVYVSEECIASFFWILYNFICDAV